MAETKRRRNKNSLRIATEAYAIAPRPLSESDFVSALLEKSQPAYAADSSGALLYSNEGYRELVEAAQKAHLKGDHGIEGDMLSPEAVARVAREQGPVWLELIVGPDASPRRYRGLHFQIDPEIGEGAFIGGIYFDFSREHALTKRAALIRDRYDDLTRLISDWIWETDRGFNLTFVSPRVMKTVGIHPSLLIGTNLFDLGRFAEATRGTPDRDSRSPFRDKLFSVTVSGGGVRQCRLSGMPVFDTVSGDFTGYRGTGNDITDEIEAKASASAAQVRLGDAIESISEAIALFNADNRLVECNQKYREYHPAIAALMVPGMSYEKIIRAGADSGQF
ncbi:MAG: PAS-domain containing protein, partial [Alphaproteobacteria bacterium]